MSRGTHWRNKEDLILVEVLTEYVAKGISIFEAFPEVSQRLKEQGSNRTIKACQSRWNNHLEKIYGKSLTIAQQKQKENADRIIQAIIDNQSPLQVIPQEESKVELLFPHVNGGVHAIQFKHGEPVMPERISDMKDAIEFLNAFDFKYRTLQKENDELMQELETAWQENEKLKLKLASYEEMDKKFESLRMLASKLEGVGV